MDETATPSAEIKLVAPTCHCFLFFFTIPIVLVFEGYLNKVLQTKTEIYFLTILETRQPRSKCWQGWLLLRPLPLAYRQMTSYVFTWSFLCVFLSSSYTESVTLN